MHRVIEVANVDDPNQNANDENDFAELVSKLLDLDLEWSLAIVIFRDCRADLSDFCVDTSADNDAKGFSRCNVCS